jgi:hypothetical protein
MFRPILLCLALLPAYTCAHEGGDWIEYRTAYRQMIWFEKYGKPKQFLENHFRIRPRDKNVAMDGLRLTLNSKDIHTVLTLDALGRAVFPFSKVAYDDNAELSVNRKPGQVKSGGWVSIVTRLDGVYPIADLRIACEQLLAYLQYSGEARDKRCAGVQFSYLKDDAVQVRYHGAGGAVIPLHGSEGPAFPGDAATAFRIFAYRFGTQPDIGQVVTGSTPLAIAALLQ